MRYLMYMSLMMIFFACGNQEHHGTKQGIRLLSEKSKVFEKKEENISSKELQKVSEPKEIEEYNSTITLPLERNESNEKIVEKQHLPSSSISEAIEENMTLVSTLEQNNTLLSTSPILKEQNVVTSEDKLKLSAIELEMKKEILSLKVAHEQSLKKMEVEMKNAKVIQEKEIALAKLENNKEMQKLQEADKKELSTIELNNKHVISLAKITSEKELAQKQKELEQIKSMNEKEVAISKLETEKEIAKRQEKIAMEKAIYEKEVALATLKSNASIGDKQLEFYKMIAMIVTGLIILALLILYLIVQRKRKNELKIQENELRHQEYLEASKQHNEHVKKMLEIITDESMDKGIKKEMMRLLKNQSSQANLIEHKK